MHSCENVSGRVGFEPMALLSHNFELCMFCSYSLYKSTEGNRYKLSDFSNGLFCAALQASDQFWYRAQLDTPPNADKMVEVCSMNSTKHYYVYVKLSNRVKNSPVVFEYPYFTSAISSVWLILSGSRHASFSNADTVLIKMECHQKSSFCEPILRAYPETMGAMDSASHTLRKCGIFEIAHLNFAKCQFILRPRPRPHVSAPLKKQSYFARARAQNQNH